MRTSIIVAIALIAAGLAPAAGAYHLSIGSRDSVVVSPQEDENAPSVARPDGGAADTLFERGMATGCYEVEGDPSAEEATEALTSDPFCGRLDYGRGSGFSNPSAVDQHLPDSAIGAFDAIYTNYVGTYGLSTCYPWCGDEDDIPGNDDVYKGAHGALADLGLVPSEGSSDGGWQTYAVNVLFPHSTLTLSEAAGVYEANGWLYPAGDGSMMAFLLDAGGDPISDTQLSAIVADRKASGDLAPGARAGVCAFTPDADISIGAAQQSFCEIEFAWADEEQATGFGDNPQSACSSPAYVCGAVQPAWYAVYACPAAYCWLDEKAVFNDFADDSTDNYDIWHYVVAPTQSSCQGALEPGFAFDTGTSLPYLAHDLDVYEPVASPLVDLNYADTYEWRRQATASVQPGSPEIPQLPSGPQLGADTAKTHRVEPNAPGDTSQGTEVIERSIDDPCSVFDPNSETTETVDPWVDVIDTQTMRYQAGPLNDYDLYLNSADQQDDDNRPGPGTYLLTGNVGMFTDKNDDGDYDTAGSGSLFQDANAIGAYPMFWDMRLDEATGQPDSLASCTNGYSETTLVEQMVDAGYGTHTGLIQVVYLTEPTAMYNALTGDTLPYPEGDTAFVFMSQGLHVLRDAGDARVTGEIQAALDHLPQTPDRVVYPADDIARFDADFETQCQQDTGGYNGAWVFLHDCTLDCQGDTTVTTYLYEVTTSDGTLGGDAIQSFDPLGDGAYAFISTGEDPIQAWTDVDPFDNDPSRNADGSSAPPTG